LDQKIKSRCHPKAVAPSRCTATYGHHGIEFRRKPALLLLPLRELFFSLAASAPALPERAQQLECRAAAIAARHEAGRLLASDC
jgi:hypothetical protein